MEVAPHRAPPAASPVEALARVGAAVADGVSLGQALLLAAEAVADAVGATLVVVRVADAEGRLCARGVASSSRALAAELEGSRLPEGIVPGDELDDRESLPAALRATAERVAADAALVVPVRVGGEVAGSLEAYRPGAAFDDEERVVVRGAAAHVAAAVRTLGHRRGDDLGPRLVEVAGEALAAGSDEELAGAEVVRIAAETGGAVGATLWSRTDGGVEVAVDFGEQEADALSAAAEAAAAVAGEDSVGRGGLRLTFSVGRPPSAALQLRFAGEPPAEAVRERLATFAGRVAHALRASDRTRAATLELDRTRALLTLVAQANEQLSLAHTLDTALDSIAELFEVERVGVYLREDGRLEPAASRGLAGPHLPVAERLLELALGAGRGVLVVPDAAAEPALAAQRRRLAELGIEAALAVPLALPGEVTGLLALYVRRGRMPSEHDRSLLAAIAAQLAFSVQNARLHEEATELGAELEQALDLERRAARQLGALYEISRSFAQSLSLEATLDAVARTVVELLEVDAAVIRMPDARGELLLPRALHVADERVDEALRTILLRPQPVDRLPVWRSARSREAIRLDAELARQLGPPHQLLVPFLEKGSTAVILPIATPSELLGTLKLLSLDPGRPITRATTELGLSIAAQAALAIDNARLYQHQKEFADTMQRSLLPRSRPELEGLQLGDVYEPSSLVDVGGDVYDFIELDDDRIAVVLGDVTGHGIDAAADMAMAKFVFRSLAREHPEPGDFLASANDVVCGEIATGKFITMLYLTVDPATGVIACASAGHPRPRLVLPRGRVEGLAVRGLALGIDPGQEYEELRTDLPRGSCVVLYTDGVIEARRGDELYGVERLDAVLAARCELPASALARAVIEDCRAWAQGELADDCAVVVLKRT
ncbi:MAG TPA: SpoIIE family protein phosphatase [Gaiellaceae bacterium]|nr:SpoIIE family protein phosphatase [Gaiellaceae bacterium]